MNTDKEVIKQLREQNNDLENYFRNTIIPQLFVDKDLILRKFTPPAMKQFKLALTDVGRPIHDILNNFMYPSIVENIQTVIDSREILEKEIQTTDFRWYQMNILPYLQKENNISNGVIITFVEITYRIKDLKEQEKLIADHETLLDTISHDIKGPLNNLGLAISQFKAMGLENQENFKTLLEIVERALSKLKDLIEELSSNRKDGHRYETQAELLNFEHILEDVRLSLNEDIRSSGAIIKCDVQVSEMTFPRRKLRSIIYNLLNNAIKYCSPLRSPEIFIQTRHDNEQLIISIRDNGIGIAENQQEAVFSKYYRVNHQVEGTGIGLYLVKQLISSMGGKIKMKSEPGKGTLIQIYLMA